MPNTFVLTYLAITRFSRLYRAQTINVFEQMITTI